MTMKTHSKRSGFTLVELIVTLAIIAILAVAVVPMFRFLIQNSRISAQVNKFVSDLTFARSEAIKQGVRVRVTALGTEATNEWGPGWRIWVDANNNDDYDAGEEVRVTRSQVAEMTLDSDVDNFTQFGFLPGGSVATNPNLFVPAVVPNPWPARFKLRIPDCTGNQARDISLSRSGAIQTTDVACE